MIKLVILSIIITTFWATNCIAQSEDEAMELFLQEYCITENSALDEQFEKVIKCRQSEAVSIKLKKRVKECHLILKLTFYLTINSYLV